MLGSDFRKAKIYYVSIRLMNSIRYNDPLFVQKYSVSVCQFRNEIDIEGSWKHLILDLSHDFVNDLLAFSKGATTTFVHINSIDLGKDISFKLWHGELVLEIVFWHIASIVWYFVFMDRHLFAVTNHNCRNPLGKRLKEGVKNSLIVSSRRFRCRKPRLSSEVYWVLLIFCRYLSARLLDLPKKQYKSPIMYQIETSIDIEEAWAEDFLNRTFLEVQRNLKALANH